MQKHHGFSGRLLILMRTNPEFASGSSLLERREFASVSFPKRFRGSALRKKS
jgi:hypothetical protein